MARNIGVVKAMMATLLTHINTPLIIERNVKGTTRSSSFRSSARRFMILPTGVLSWKLSGALISLCIRFKCMFLEPRIPPIAILVKLQISKTPATKNEQFGYPEKDGIIK